MATTTIRKEFIPATEVQTLKNYSNKVKKYLPNFNVTFSEPFDEVFRHTMFIKDEEGHNRVTTFKQTHRVVEIEITQPFTEWELLASYIDGTFISNSTTKIEYANKNHGHDYGKCDCCNHKTRNSHVVRNKNTNEELQVGGECLKKFGLKDIAWLTKFNAELNRTIDLIGTSDGEGNYIIYQEKKTWMKGSYPTANVIAAAIEVYNSKPKWEKGVTMNTILNKVEKMDEEQQTSDEVKEVLDFCSRIEVKGTWDDFNDNMKRLSNNYYTKVESFVFAFFAKKNLEDKKRLDAQPKPDFEENDYIHIVGKIINTKYISTIYGVAEVNRIVSNKGFVFERMGKVNRDENGNVDIYTISEGNFKGVTYLGRCTKNPKKGITYKEA